MITVFKIFESINDDFLLCVKETDPHYYWKFTKGKKYKIYTSKLGLRIKDDNGKFDRLIGIENDKGVITWNYADGIFTTDKSILDYELRIGIEKYNI